MVICNISSLVTIVIIGVVNYTIYYCTRNFIDYFLLFLFFFLFFKDFFYIHFFFYKVFFFYYEFFFFIFFFFYEVFWIKSVKVLNFILTIASSLNWRQLITTISMLTMNSICSFSDIIMLAMSHMSRWLKMTLCFTRLKLHIVLLDKFNLKKFYFVSSKLSYTKTFQLPYSSFNLFDAFCDAPNAFSVMLKSVVSRFPSLHGALVSVTPFVVIVEVDVYLGGSQSTI